MERCFTNELGNQIRMSVAHEGTDLALGTYPFTLGYTDGKGVPIRVVVHDSDEADAAFAEMFKASPLGEAIPYSVD